MFSTITEDGDEMAYLITGSLGFIGSRLATELMAQNEQVIGVDNLSSYYDPSIKRKRLNQLSNAKNSKLFKFIEGDIIDIYTELEKIEVNGLFHLAGQPGVRASWGVGFKDYVDWNIYASHLLLETFSKRVPIVIASSSSVYGNTTGTISESIQVPRPINPYGVSKLSTELLASVYRERDSSAIASLRLFTVYGPGQRPDMAFTRIVNSLIHDELFQIYGDGHQLRDFTFVDDVVRAFLMAMSNKISGEFNVGSSNPISLINAINFFERHADKKLRLEYLPTVDGDAESTYANISKLSTTTGWTPLTSFESGTLQQWNHANKLDESRG
jgi:UDP-glucuronate 4-epimerase